MLAVVTVARLGDLSRFEATFLGFLGWATPFKVLKRLKSVVGMDLLKIITIVLGEDDH